MTLSKSVKFDVCDSENGSYFQGCVLIMVVT